VSPDSSRRCRLILLGYVGQLEHSHVSHRMRQTSKSSNAAINRSDLTRSYAFPGFLGPSIHELTEIHLFQETVDLLGFRQAQIN
jgi:hypothetical protein